MNEEFKELVTQFTQQAGNFIYQYKCAMDLFHMARRNSLAYRKHIAVDSNGKAYTGRVLEKLRSLGFSVYYSNGYYALQFDTAGEPIVIVDLGRDYSDTNECAVEVVIYAVECFADEVLRYIEEVPVNRVISCGKMGFDNRNKVFTYHSVNVPDAALGHTEFYPFLKEPIDDFIEGYFNSNASVLLLIGEPGTGKSSFIRKMIHHTPDNKSAIAFGGILNHPEFFNSFLENPRKVLYIEDADLLVSPRADGNSQMQGMLNGTDGVLGFNKKVVISTNLENVSKIDKALIRDGRCYAILHFRPLNWTESNTVLELLGKPLLPESEIGTKHTLANLLAPSKVIDDSNVGTVKVGFNLK